MPETPGEESDAHKERRVTAPILRAKLQVPHAIINEWKTQQTKNGRRERRKVGVEIATLSVITAYTIIAGWQGCEMRRTVALTQHGAEMAAKQFELSERPWLSAEMKVIEPLTFDEASGNGSIGIEVLLKNTGRSVAMNARVINYLIGDLLTPENIVATQDLLCERFRKENELQLGNVIFPGDTERTMYRVYIRKAEIDAASKRLEASATSQRLEEVARIWHGRIIPSLITCIDYRFALSPTSGHHQTRYLSLVGERVDAFSQTSAIVPRGVIHAQLWRIFYGQYAD